MNKLLVVIIVSSLTVALVGCKKNEVKQQTSVAQPGMNGAMAPASTENIVLSGKVAETMNSGGYTYVSIEKSGKKTWVAIPLTPVRVGQEIALQPGMEMKNFTSKTLNRTFESVIFSGGLMPATGSTSGNPAH